MVAIFTTSLNCVCRPSGGVTTSTTANDSQPSGQTTGQPSLTSQGTEKGGQAGLIDRFAPDSRPPTAHLAPLIAINPPQEHVGQNAAHKTKRIAH
jgi:hypothetical protein